MWILPEGFAAKGRYEVVTAPAGKCPVKLRFDGDKPTREDVEDWANSVRDKMLGRNLWLTNAALAYWFREEIGQFHYKSDEARFYGFVLATLTDAYKLDAA